MKKFLLSGIFVFVTFVYSNGQTYVTKSPASYTVYKSTTNGLKIQAANDQLISGSWFNSSFTCGATPATDYSCTVKEHKVSFNGGTTKSDYYNYMPSSGTSQVYTRYEGSYNCNYSYIDASKQICNVGTGSNYGLQGTYTITIKDPQVSSTTITVSSGATINLSSYLSGDTGFTYKEGAASLSSTSYTPSAGTHTVTVSKSYANGTWSQSITVYAVAAPTTANAVTNVGEYCGSQSNLTLTASGSTAAVGTVVYDWYNASSGGTKVKSNSDSYTISPSSTVTYYVETHVTVNGLTKTQGTRFAATVTINPIPGIPTSVTNTGNFCGGQTIAMVASGGSDANEYSWWNAASGGTKYTTGVSTGTKTGDTFTKTFSSVTSATNYDYWIETKGSAGCISTSRKKVTITIKPVPVKPTNNTTQFLCAYDAPGNVTLQVSGDPSATWHWSTNTSFSDQISTTNSFTAVGISSTKTYYVRQNVNGCNSDYISVQAKVNPLPAVPTAVDGEVCITGKPTVSVTGVTGSDYRWYLNSTGGTKINSTSSKSYTPSSNLNTTQSYWFEYTDGNGCNLENRIEVKGIVNPAAAEAIVSDQHRCESGTVSLNVSNAQTGYTYKWYEVSAGGSQLGSGIIFTTPTLSISKQYYVETISNKGCSTASGNRVAVTAYVESNPSPPGTINQTHCNGGSFELVAAGTPTGGTYRWFDSDHVFLSEGATYTTPVINSTTDYYVESKSQYGCLSTESLLTVTIVGDVPAPTANDKSVCDHGSVNLTATGGNVGDTYHWYDSDISGFPLVSTPSYQTLDLNTTTSFFVEIETADGCVSPRTEVQAIVNPLPTLSIGGTLYLCTVGDIYDLTQDEGTTSGGTWSGSGVAAGKFYSGTTGAGEFTVTYNYTDPLTGCNNSATRTVSVAQTVSVDAGSDLEVCQESGSIDLYNQSFTPAGGLFSSTNTDVDNNIDNSSVALDLSGINAGVYEIKYTVGGSGCESSDVFLLTVHEKPIAPTVLEGAVCGEGTIELQLQGSSTGQFYNWYENETDVTALQTGSSLVTPTLTASKTYYVAIKNGNTGCEGSRVPITATVYPVPTIDAGTDLQFCDANASRDLTSDASVLNGVWSGPGISGNSWSATGLAEGEHILTYTYTTADGCSAVDDRIFTIGLDGGVSVTANNYMIGEPIYFESTFDPSSIVSIEWNFGDQWTSFEPLAIHSYFAPGIYDIAYTVNLDNGCTGTFTFPERVTIEGEQVQIITGIQDGEIITEPMVYPTLVTNSLSLHYYSEKADWLKISIVSPQGILIDEITRPTVKGENTISLNDVVSKLPVGLNFIVINNKALKIIRK